MIILPAIDIKDGKCVRLYKGDFNTVEQVADDPLQTALSFAACGSAWVHMVDLDGSLEGKRINGDIFTEIARKSGLLTELGGGIRDMSAVAYYIENGISRVILGTAAVRNPAFVTEAVKEYGDKIAVGIDAKNGKVAANGWTDVSDIDYIELAKRMEDVGVKTIIYTDISKDGTLTGPNTGHYKRLSEAVSCRIIASGGIKDIEDIKALKELDMYGAICGKSLYSGTLNLKEALEIGGNKNMSVKKIIPCLDVKNGRVVKGINFVDIKDVGDPVECAKRYEEQGADEIVLLDITATNENRGTMTDVVSKVAKQVTIPFAVGGGIGSIDDIRNVLQAGADKVSMNSAAVRNPQLIKEAAEKFGSRCIVVAIDVKQKDSGFTVVTNGGKVDAGIDAVTWAKQVESLGAGEILLTSMDADGTKNGFDIEITKLIAEAVDIPVTASGGCGTLSHFSEVFEKTGASAALAASLFHYGELTVGQVKRHLQEKNIPVSLKDEK